MQHDNVLKIGSISIGFEDIIIFLLIVGCISFGDIDFLCLGAQALAFSILIFKFLRGISVSKLYLNYISWIALFFLYCTFSTFWASGTNNTVFSTSLSFLQSGLISICIILYCETYNNILKTIYFIILSSLVLCVRFFATVPVSQWGAIRSTSTNAIFLSNNTAMAMAFAAVCILWLRFFTRDSKKWEKVVAVITAFLMMAIVMMMGTKKGLLIFAVGVAICYLYQSKNFLSSLVRIIIVCVVAWIAYYFLLNNSFMYEVIGYRIELMIGGLTGTSTDESTRTRMLFIQAAINIFKQNPILGVGQDGFRYLNPYQFTYSHNNYTEILANLGIVGFLIYYGYHISLLLKSFRFLGKNVMPVVIMIIIFVTDYSSVSYSSEVKAIWLALVIAFANIFDYGEDYE